MSFGTFLVTIVFFLEISQDDGKVQESNGHLPIKPNITDCRVYNWVKMVCRWEPFQNDTTQTLYWKFGHTWSMPDKQPCKRQEMLNCTWMNDKRADNFIFYLTYSVYVQAVNAYGATVNSDELLFEPQNKVQPDSVGNFEATPTATTCQLTWSSPSEENTLVYETEYRSEYDEVSQVVNTTSTRQLLKALLPFAFYEVSIRAFPCKDKFCADLKGFWSVPRTLAFKTLDSVPGTYPPVSSGGFYVHDSQSQFRDVTFYWKRLDPIDRHGIIEKYRIRLCLSDDFDTTKQTCDKYEEPIVTKDDTPYDTVKIKKDSTFYAAVDAMTKLGPNDNLSLPYLEIRKESEAIPAVSNFAAIWNGAINATRLSWTAPNISTITSFTIYWCEQPNRCRTKNGLDWMAVPANESEVLLPLGQQYYFAISVEGRFSLNNTLVSSSGMLWSLCTYDILKDIRQPFEGSFRVDRRLLEHAIVVTWLFPGCENFGYIKEFIVVWHLVGNPASEHNVTVPANSSGSYTYVIHGLHAGAKYAVRVGSASPYAAVPAWTKEIFVTLEAEGLTRNQWIGYISGSIAGGLLIMALFAYCIFRCRKFWSKDNFQPKLPDIGPSGGGLVSYKNPNYCSYHQLSSEHIPMRELSSKELETSVDSVEMKPLLNGTDNHFTADQQSEGSNSTGNKRPSLDSEGVTWTTIALVSDTEGKVEGLGKEVVKEDSQQDYARMKISYMT